MIHAEDGKSRTQECMAKHAALLTQITLTGTVLFLTGNLNPQLIYTNRKREYTALWLKGKKIRH